VQANEVTQKILYNTRVCVRVCVCEINVQTNEITQNTVHSSCLLAMHTQYYRIVYDDYPICMRVPLLLRYLLPSIDTPLIK
jgi:hypothetical protein